MIRFRLLAATCLLCAAPAAALAQGPEQLDQLEPGAGEGQAEYFATIGPDGEGEDALEGMFGINARFAVGVEIEAEREGGALAFETIGVKALYRLTDDEAPVAVGLQAQLSFDDRARLVEGEARLIAEAKPGAWWLQANAMLRRSGGDEPAATRLAYALSLQRAVTSFAWLGVEASGQSAPLSADTGASAGPGQFAGPSLTLEWEPSEAFEVEIGLAYFRRIAGEGPAGAGRLFVQLSF
jgi:hypothetical protein